MRLFEFHGAHVAAHLSELLFIFVFLARKWVLIFARSWVVLAVGVVDLTVSLALIYHLAAFSSLHLLGLLVLGIVSLDQVHVLFVAANIIVFVIHIL